MPQSLSRITIHLVYSTKDRVRSLAYPELREELAAYMIGIFKNLKCPSICTRVLPDHVHTLHVLARTTTIASIVETVKKDTSKWVRRQLPERTDPYLMKFSWQKGYGAFSVSESKILDVVSYIEGQEEHHRRVSFQEEYRALLARHRVIFDERYVWD